MQRDALAAYLDQLLEPGRFKDYCPNGLQVEGREPIRRLVCGVTACQALLDAAVAQEADGVLVHHGWFWRGEDGRVTGFRKQRLATLLGRDINLFAYHLPLDAHPELGNNAQWAQACGWEAEARFGDQNLGWLGRLPIPIPAATLAERVSACLGRPVQLFGDGERPVKRLGWCSGGAQGFFEGAILGGADAYLSGEVSEQTVHLARESGVPYLACGHHATERGGARALADHLAERFGLDCRFIDIDNPV